MVTPSPFVLPLVITDALAPLSAPLTTSSFLRGDSVLSVLMWISTMTGTDSQTGWNNLELSWPVGLILNNSELRWASNNCWQPLRGVSKNQWNFPRFGRIGQLGNDIILEDNKRKTRPLSDSEAATMYKLKRKSSNMQTGQGFKYKELVHPAGPSSWSFQLVCVH